MALSRDVPNTVAQGQYTKVEAQNRPDSREPSKTQQQTPEWQRLAVDHWGWEISAAVLCIGVLAAIVGVLIGYDQQPVPDLPDGLTINAIIAFLSTLAKSALVLVITAVIRQEEWLWYIDAPRRLSHVDDFDEASRGPYGSFLLLIRARGSLRVLLAATITVLALGFEPFLQQLVTIKARSVPILNTSASIRSPKDYAETNNNQLTFDAQIGAFGGADGVIPPPVCPSGNCTWPDYDTLALCTVCEDVTSQVTVRDAFNISLIHMSQDFAASNQTGNSKQWQPIYSLSNGNNVSVDVGLFLDLSSVVQWSIDYPRRVVWQLNVDTAESDLSMWVANWKNGTFAGTKGPLFAMGYLDLNLTSDSSALKVNRATECAFTPCVRTMSSRVEAGSLSSNTTHTDFGQVYLEEMDDQGRTISGWRSNVNGTDYSVLDTGVGNVQGNSYRLMETLQLVLGGNTTYVYGGYYYDTDHSIDAADQTSSGLDSGGPWSSTGQQAIDVADDFESIAQGVAKALTGRFQNLANSSSVVNGTTLRPESIIQVRWIWIIYPATLVVLGLLVLLATIYSTHAARMAVWKESTLPLLFRYINPEIAAHHDTSPRRHTEPLPPSPPRGRTPNGVVVGKLPDTNRVTSIVHEASQEMVQLRRRNNTTWMLESDGMRLYEETGHHQQHLRHSSSDRSDYEMT
jgi:hypothetical protein